MENLCMFKDMQEDGTLILQLQVSSAFPRIKVEMPCQHFKMISLLDDNISAILVFEGDC
jgi:hypothetical protein